MEGERMEGGDRRSKTEPSFTDHRLTYRSGKCEEIEYWDKISDMKLSTRKQLIVRILVMEIYLDI